MLKLTVKETINKVTVAINGQRTYVAVDDEGKTTLREVFEAILAEEGGSVPGLARTEEGEILVSDDVFVQREGEPHFKTDDLETIVEAGSQVVCAKKYHNGC